MKVFAGKEKFSDNMIMIYIRSKFRVLNQKKNLLIFVLEKKKKKEIEKGSTK